MPKVVSAGGEEVGVDALAVRDPHDLGGGVGVVEGALRGELGRFLVQGDNLKLKIVTKCKEFCKIPKLAFYNKNNETTEASYVLCQNQNKIRKQCENSWHIYFNCERGRGGYLN